MRIVSIFRDWLYWLKPKGESAKMHNCNCHNLTPELRIIRMLSRMENQMTLNKAELLARLDAAEENLRGDVARQADEIVRLKEELIVKLEEALADKAAAVEAAIQDTLDGFDAVADDLAALAAQTPEPVVEEEEPPPPVEEEPPPPVEEEPPPPDPEPPVVEEPAPPVDEPVVFGPEDN